LSVKYEIKMMIKLKIVLLALTFCLFPKLAFSLETDEQKISDLEKAVVAICHSKPDIKNIQGTGFIVTSTGIVITSDHVITNNQGCVFNRLFALRPNYPKVESFQLTVVKRFRKGLKGRDIAILKIIPESLPADLPYISVGEKAEIGDPILVVGFPLVFNKVYSWPLFRSGIVASTRYNIENSAILVLDLGPVEGYSGSPVISLKTHKVVGIFKGHSKDRPQTDFVIATILEKSDIQSLE